MLWPRVRLGRLLALLALPRMLLAAVLAGVLPLLSALRLLALTLLVLVLLPGILWALTLLALTPLALMPLALMPLAVMPLALMRWWPLTLVPLWVVGVLLLLLLLSGLGLPPVCRLPLEPHPGPASRGGRGAGSAPAAHHRQFKNGPLALCWRTPPDGC